MKSNADKHGMKSAAKREPHEHRDHHAHMAADFRKRFWISLVLTLPILGLSPVLQKLVGLREAIGLAGDLYVLFGLSTAVFFYGGWPFLKGLYGELASCQPGMMTLVVVAITTAYAYSNAVVFGLAGKVFFWELATLVDIMLLGHWIEMKSVMGASKALEEVAKLMPSDAHKLMADGSVKDMPLSELWVDAKVLIKPGEKVLADGVIEEGGARARSMRRCSPAMTTRRPHGSRTKSDWMNTSPTSCPRTRLPKSKRSNPGVCRWL